MLPLTSSWLADNCKFAAWDEYNETGQNRFWAIHQLRDFVDEMRKRSRASNAALAEVVSKHLRAHFVKQHKEAIEFYERESGMSINTPVDLKKAKEQIQSRMSMEADPMAASQEPVWPKLPRYALPMSPDTSPRIVEQYFDYHFKHKR